MSVCTLRMRHNALRSMSFDELSLLGLRPCLASAYAIMRFSMPNMPSARFLADFLPIISFSGSERAVSLQHILKDVLGPVENVNLRSF